MTPACPTCGTTGTPVLFGLPAPSADEAAAEGKLILRGCVQPLDPPQWECPDGHEWAGDEDEWSGVLDDVLSGRPHCRSCGGLTNYLIYPGAEELFLDELARGEAEVAVDPGPQWANWARICRSCRAIT
ncbi:MAG TPA: hypothetical protein VF062_05625 [Candidatus Limnocylindrales bacterium]